MKKYALLIIVGGLFLMIGVILSFNKKKDVIYYVDEDNMTEEEVTSLIMEKTKTIVELYENSKNTFKLSEEQDEESEYLVITNYDEVVDKLYTEKGKTELENIKFNNKNFITKNEDKVYVLKTLPESNLYSDCSISISNVNYNKDEIKAVVSFTKNNVDNNDVLTYYVYEKNIELILKDNKWLINTFIYSNI